MQLWLHIKVFKGRSCRAFSEQPRAATAAPGAKQAAFLRQHQQWSLWLWVVVFTSLPPYTTQEPLAAGLCFQPPWGQNSTAAGATATCGTYQPCSLEADSRVGWVLPHCCCLRAKFWTQESSLGLGQNEERDEYPAWCFTASEHRPAAEQTAQTKCLQVGQLKLLHIILFIKNGSIVKFVYIYIYFYGFYSQI